MPNNTDVDVICPFYMWSTEQSISCEYPDVNKVQLWFDSHILKLKHQGKYCNSFDYRKCPMARLNEEFFKE